MTQIAPISRATLDVALLNEHAESTLTLGQSDQTLTLELRNTTPHDLMFGDTHGTVLTVTFRPGALINPGRIAASAQGWTGTAKARQEFPTIELTRPDRATLKAGEALRFRVTGLTPSGAGGSRSTRVELAYSNVHAPDGAKLAGRRTIHLSLLHPNVPMGSVLGQSGSTGPFRAELLGSADVIRGGQQNVIRIGLSARTPVTVQPADAKGRPGDGTSKVHVSFPTGEGDRMQFYGQAEAPMTVPTRWSDWDDGGNVLRITNTSDFTFRMLRVTKDGQIVRDAPIKPGATWQKVANMGSVWIISDSRDGTYLKLIPNIAIGSNNVFDFDGTPERDAAKWAANRKTITYQSTDDAPLNGHFLYFHLAINTNLEPGLYPLTLRLENVNDTDTEIALLLNVTAMGMPGISPVDAYINAPGKLEVTAPSTRFSGSVDVDGGLTVKGDLKASNNTLHFNDGWKLGRQRSGSTNWFFFRNPQSKSIFYIQENSGSISLGQNAGKALEIHSDQNVGINTRSPKHTLDVNGAIGGKSLTVSGNMEANLLKLRNGGVCMEFAFGWKFYIVRSQFIIQQGTKNLLYVQSDGKIIGRSGAFSHGLHITPKAGE